MIRNQTTEVLLEVERERERQDAKWGEQNHWDGTGGRYAAEEAERARLLCQTAARLGQVTWADILKEEVAEALAEVDDAALRAELVQVAAVAVSWVECIDRRPA